MPLVIGSGPSVTDYSKPEVISLANYAFTLCVNSVAFEYPADIIVALDPQWILDNFNILKQIGKPVIARKYPAIEGLELDFIWVPMDTIERYPYSGMVAVKIADSLAVKTEGRPSYVLGIDGGTGNYKGYKGGGNYTKGSYDELNLSKTVSLSIHSRISCWPKLSKLPNPRKVIVTPEYRAVTTAFIRGEVEKLLA
jgi:hypothetical protein